MSAVLIIFMAEAWNYAWKVPVSSVISCHPSIGTYQLGSYWTGFCEIWYWRLLLKSLKKIQVWLKTGQIIRYFTWRPKYIYIAESFIPLACAECDDSLPFSGASSVPLCYVLFPATLLHQLFFHPLSPHLAIYFLVYLSVLLFPNSYIIPFWEFCFLPFSVHAQTNIIYLTLLSLL